MELNTKNDCDIVLTSNASREIIKKDKEEIVFEYAAGVINFVDRNKNTKTRKPKMWRKERS